MKALFFDTETTGLADLASPADAAHQPYLVELAALLVQDGRELARLEMLVKPQGWTIPEDATRVHGITTERATREGLPLDEVFAAFLALARSADKLVAHNLDFDALVMRAAAARCGYTPPPPGAWQEVEHRGFCTMRAATPICRLPGGRRGDYKWPSLAEAHAHFYGRAHEGAHGALADVLACHRVFEALHGRPVKPSRCTGELIQALAGFKTELVETARSRRKAGDEPAELAFFSCAERLVEIVREFLRPTSGLPDFGADEGGEA